MAIQSDEGGRLLAALPTDERLRSAHAVAGDGQVASAGAAAAPIAAVLPGGALTAPVLRALGPLTRGSYALIADNRSRLGRLLSPEMLRRADAVLAARTAPGR